MASILHTAPIFHILSTFVCVTLATECCYQGTKLLPCWVARKKGTNMADVNRGNRPLSPHLTIYRPQLTSITSIFVRITGNALLVGALMVVWWFAAASFFLVFVRGVAWFHARHSASIDVPPHAMGTS
jgi:hypothetical protein